jgi:hypothetical protein
MTFEDKGVANQSVSSRRQHSKKNDWDGAWGLPNKGPPISVGASEALDP